MAAESLLPEHNDVLISIDFRSPRLYVCIKGCKFDQKNLAEKIIDEAFTFAFSKKYDRKLIKSMS